METLVSGLILAALSGLTFLAYRHPEAYEKIYVPFVLAYGVIFIGTVGWNFGVLKTTYAVLDEIGYNFLDDAEKAKERLLLPEWLWLVLIGLYLYMTFLATLPKITGAQKPPDPQNGEKHD